MKSLFIVNTVYQLFVAINMRVNNLPQEDADIAVSDHTSSLRDYIESLKESGLFREVFYIETLAFDKYFWSLSNFWKPLCFINHKKHTSRVFEPAGVAINCYDNIYTSNLDAFVKFVYQTYPQLNYYLFEDGAGVCVSDWKKVSEKWNYIHGFNDVYDDIKGLFLYTPDLMCVDLGYDMLILPSVDTHDRKLIDLYNKIFDYDTRFTYPDFVFVEQSFPIDKIKNNDFDFMRATYEIVGYNNLFVKYHPRNEINRSFVYGLSKVIECSWPFELLLLNCKDFSKKTFITVNSGSLISSRVLFQQDIRTVFLYKAITGSIHFPHSNDIFVDYMDKFVDKYKSKNLIVPQTLKQYKAILSVLTMQEN